MLILRAGIPTSPSAEGPECQVHGTLLSYRPVTSPTFAPPQTPFRSIVATIPTTTKKWQPSRRNAGHLPSERWQSSLGIAGHFASEYAAGAFFCRATTVPRSSRAPRQSALGHRNRWAPPIPHSGQAHLAGQERLREDRDQNKGLWRLADRQETHLQLIGPQRELVR